MKKILAIITCLGVLGTVKVANAESVNIKPEALINVLKSGDAKDIDKVKFVKVLKQLSYITDENIWIACRYSVPQDTGKEICTEFIKKVLAEHNRLVDNVKYAEELGKPENWKTMEVLQTAGESQDVKKLNNDIITTETVAVAERTVFQINNDKSVPSNNAVILSTDDTDGFVTEESCLRQAKKISDNGIECRYNSSSGKWNFVYTIHNDDECKCDVSNHAHEHAKTCKYKMMMNHFECIAATCEYGFKISNHFCVSDEYD